MDLRIKAWKVTLYDNRVGRLSCKQVRAQTGADYVLNCVAFNFSTFQPVMGLRMDGKTLVLDDDYLGLSWNSGSDVTLERASAGKANYMTFVPLVKDGQAQKLYIGADVKGSRQRTAVGVYPDGTLWLYAVKSPTKTPEQMQALALEKGCVHALLLDGGGSTCGSSVAEEVTTTRPIPIFLCVWEDRSVEGGDGTVKKYSKKKDGNLKLQPNFTVREFACKDGSDEILISDKLPEVLQKIRGHFGTAVTITSGYRTPAYNVSIGGAKASQHCLGTAADIVVTGATPREVAQYAEKLLGDAGGIGLYGGFTHVDVREKRARWDSTSGRELAVDWFYNTTCPYMEPNGNVYCGMRGEAVKWVQWQLVRHSGKLDVDGIFGNATRLAVRAFQQKNGLDVDGIVGKMTRWKLKG